MLERPITRCVAAWVARVGNDHPDASVPLFTTLDPPADAKPPVDAISNIFVWLLSPVNVAALDAWATTSSNNVFILW